MSNSNTTLIPIGSVVKLKKVEKPVMIYGRHQIQTSSKRIFDYIAVPYPEGNLTDDFNVFFNRESIDNILYRGYDSPIELILREQVEKDLENSKKKEKTDEI
ncbi:DUF4176 domain-containing protein [Terribacillus sp. DMT04]|uniref:DUF4176 domain-containing protein n=1 Tax=Terribacillus sp. DMT04 TaxID=2850441 RepID=UPI001C2C5CE3|nr:DUF4176 domain-containing protein [Terribacillus sp. DMT04]QXE00990.1 DUF4176 domain-containing protein [Terribacillus sp. DMT04]